MKKFVYTVFVAFWSALLTLIIIHAMSPETSDDEISNEIRVYALADVAEHDSLESCWMAIEGNVYDFTDYIPDHPSPPSVVEAWCGREASEGMRTKGHGRNHSRRAWAMMEDYLIGTLREH